VSDSAAPSLLPHPEDARSAVSKGAMTVPSPPFETQASGLLLRVRALGKIGRDAATRVLDIVLPPRCLSCGGSVGEHGQLCASCWAEVSFIAPPVCAACGTPFAFDGGPGALCGACIAARPPYGRARAVMRYDDGARALLLGFKHADRTDRAPALARWMARAGPELLAEADVIVPVPLHRWRLLHRRFNQSALLAHALGRIAGTPVAAGLLCRRRNTPPQGTLTRAQREDNVSGAFQVRAGQAVRVAGRRVLLVDDVLTTGATATACTEALLEAGARRVDLLMLARTLP
jgi:ComF family protein